LVSVGAQAQDKTGVVTLVRLTGRAAYSIDGGRTWIPAVVGKEFKPGTLIRTEDKALADLLIGESLPERNLAVMNLNTRDQYYGARNLAGRNSPPIIDKNTVRLQPNTILGVDKLVIPDQDPTVISDCELDLKKGKIFASVKKVSPSSEYMVKVPNGVAAVRGTTLSLSVEGADVNCQVSSGTVWMSITMVNGTSGAPMTDGNGNPLPPVQISIPSGSGFSLTPAVLSTITSMATGGIATTPAAVANLIAQITATATSQVTALTVGQTTTLTTSIAGVTTTAVTITSPVSSVLPTDTGTTSPVSP
jgi:hypothetical protein